jgi:hypothetical protein
VECFFDLSSSFYNIRLLGEGAEYCVAIPLQKIGLLAGSLNDIMHKAT